MRAISSVGQSNRLITGRSGVRVPDGPPKKMLTKVSIFFVYIILNIAKYAAVSTKANDSTAKTTFIIILLVLSIVTPILF